MDENIIFLNKKIKKQKLFRIEKTTRKNNKKAKSEEKNPLEKEFDFCLSKYLQSILIYCLNFVTLTIEDYTYYSYNDFKEIKNSEEFQRIIKKVLDDSKNNSFFGKVYNFIIERKKILENSEKYGLKWFKDYIKNRNENNNIYENNNSSVEDYKKLNKNEQEEIFIAELINYSFKYIADEEIKFDTSINIQNNNINNSEIKIEAQNFNLKEDGLMILISGFKFNNNNLTEINLIGNELTPKSCFYLGTVFKYNQKNIKILNLSRCSLNNKCLYMFIIGTTFSSEELNKEPIYLEKLILKENDKINDENISENEYPLSLIMQKFVVKNLNLMNTKIGNLGLKKLCNTFLDLLNNQKEKKFTIQTLNLYNIGLKNEDSLQLLGDILAHEKNTIEILVLNKNSISTPIPISQKNIFVPNYFEYFMDKVAESITLKELLLLKCEIGKNKKDIEIMCKMLEKNKYLESLRMFDNLINDEEDFLKILNLFSEYKTEIKNKSLKSLDLSKNRCNLKISEDFLNMIDNMNLEYLDINQNYMDEKEKEIFRKRTNALDQIKIIY